VTAERRPGDNQGISPGEWLAGIQQDANLPVRRRCDQAMSGRCRCLTRCGPKSNRLARSLPFQLSLRAADEFNEISAHEIGDQEVQAARHRVGRINRSPDPYPRYDERPDRRHAAQCSVRVRKSLIREVLAQPWSFCLSIR